MKKKILYGLWAGFYVICGALGYTVQSPKGLQSFAMITLSLLFFVPPAILLADALRAGDKKTVKLIRWLSIASLSLTAIFLVANVVSALGSPALGNVMYAILIAVSVPMVSGLYWYVSLFLWACLLFVTLEKRKK